MATDLRVKLLLFLSLIAGAAMGHVLSAQPARWDLSAQLKSIPLNFGDVTGLEDQIDARTLDVLQATQTLNRQYFLGDDKYWLFVGYFAHQQFGSQIHSPRHCYPGSGWNIASMTVSNRLGASTGELVIQRDKDRRVVLYQFLMRGGGTASEYRLKLEMIKNALLRRPQDAAFVRFSTPIGRGESEAAALDRLSRFSELLAPSIEPALPFQDR